MKRIISLISTALLFLIISLPGFSQANDPVLLQVAGEQVTQNEFLKVFEKNNNKAEAPDNKALEEYLDLYINFRLKVTEAKALGMDTLKSFRDELAGYRKQLANPYLVDNQKTEKMIQEAYDRMMYDVRVSHILVKVDRLASAADTLAAWNKIMLLRNRIVKAKILAKWLPKLRKIFQRKAARLKATKLKGIMVI